jgi:hypothetical protein
MCGVTVRKECPDTGDPYFGWVNQVPVTAHKVKGALGVLCDKVQGTSKFCVLCQEAIQ